MNARNAVAAALFLLGIGGGLGLRLWASDAALAIVGPNQVQVTEDGSVLVAAGSYFYAFDYDQTQTHKVPAGEFGSDAYVGPMHAIDAHTILIRNDRVMDDSLERNLNAYARIREGPLDQRSDQPGIIQRCDLSDAQCTTVGSGDTFHSRRVFSLTQDPKTGRIFVADTAAWEVFLLDGNGQVVMRNDGNLTFPNKIDWLDGQLWVADTNGHRLLQISPRASSFGTVIKAVAVPRGEFDWPIAFARTVSGQFVVAKANRAFDDSRVALLSAKGSLVRWLDLPDSADVLDIALWGDELLLADYRGFAIHRFSARGDRLEPFGSETFLADMREQRDQRAIWEVLAQVGLALMALALIALIVVNARVPRDA